jgi:GT2 family glycosyltransferase
VTEPARVGVVIVTYNARPHIDRCLSALAAQSRPPDRIVLIDNHSADGTMAEAQSVAARLGLAVEWVNAGANIGFAAANNRAVERLDDCELVATLNPDAFPAPAWLASLVDAAAAHPEAASFASLLLSAGDGDRLDGAGDVYHVSGLAWRHGHGLPRDGVPEAGVARPVFSACAAAALYRRADWMDAGGFDERFFCYAEDVDLGFRLQLRGRQCWYVPLAVAYHVGSASSAVDSSFAVYHGHRNLEWAFLKNMPGTLLLRFLPLHLASSLGAIVWFAVRGRGAAVLKAKWDALIGVPKVWPQRLQAQQRSVVDPSTLLALLDRAPLRTRFAARASRPAT